MFLMKTRQSRLLLWSLGLWAGLSLFAAPPVQPAAETPELAGRQWAQAWLDRARDRFSLVHPVNLKGTPEEAGFDFSVEAQRFTKPLVTGPLALVLNLSAGYPYPQSATDFQFWITRIANNTMRQRYQQIMTDLTEHYQARGYSQTRARLLAEDLFHQKSAIYYPLVHHASPNLGALGPKDSRNPYGTSTLANSAADNYNLGLLCQKVGNHEQAAQLFHQAAQTGHAGAQASLAYLYETGQGVTKDVTQAVSFYSQAARQGQAVAQYNLGRIYQNGLKDGRQQVPSNPKTAEYYLQRAASQGVVSAYHQLGVLYYNLGVRLSSKHLTEEEFKKWDTDEDKVISPQENQYLRDAHDHFLLASQQNYGPSQHALGVMYLQGYGVPADASQSVHWLQQAVKHPQPDSYYNLAQLYEQGRGTKRNLARAFLLYRQAARMSHAPSQYNVGLFYYQGRRAGTLISQKVPESFVANHPYLIDDMIALDPQRHAVLEQATALYRPAQPEEALRTLDLFVADEHVQLIVSVLKSMLPAEVDVSDSILAPLGGDDPVQASAWWTLAAEQNQPAAQQGLELVNRVLTREQVHFAKAIATTEKKRMNLPSPTLPLGQSPTALAFAPADWGTGFFVSKDGFVIAGKHLLQSGNRFQVTTENGTFPAQVVYVPGDMDQYLLLKIQGDYDFPALSLHSSHGTRLNDPVNVLGYQLPETSEQSQPRPAKADTAIHGILGAQADPRFFTLRTPVLGDRILMQFERYLDDASSLNQSFANTPEAQERLFRLQTTSIERLRGALRASHVLLGAADLSIGYQLKEALWYDGVHHQWLKQPDAQQRARHYPAQSWVALDLRHIHVAPPEGSVETNQALVRLSAVPGMWQRGKTLSRLYEVAEELLTKPVPGKQARTQLESIIQDAKFSVLKRTAGFRGAALLNRQGQAIGLFFPGSHRRSPDVFKNFNSYHRYMLKSDHLLSFLKRSAKVAYQTEPIELPKLAAAGPVPMDREAYWLAKAQASMVLVQVSAGQPVAAKGGPQ